MVGGSVAAAVVAVAALSARVVSAAFVASSLGVLVSVFCEMNRER